MTAPDMCILVLNARTDPMERNVPFRTMRDLGLEVVLVSNLEEPGVDPALIDDLWVLDTFDVDGAIAEIERRAATRSRPIDGIVTWGDRDVQLLARVADRLGLRGMPIAAADIARNKLRMREALAVRPDLIPPFARVVSEDDLREAVDVIGYPAVLKPAGASSSKAVRVLEGHEPLGDVFRELSALADPRRDPAHSYLPGVFMLEGFMSGHEVSVEGLVTDDGVHVAAITDKETTHPHKIELSQVIPTRLPPETVDVLVQLANDVVAILGLRSCAFHLEAMVNGGRAKVVEIGARPAGGLIASHLVPLATGWNFTEQIIKNVLGLPVTAPPDIHDVQRAAGIRFLYVDPDSDGIFTGVRIPRDVAARLHGDWWITMPKGTRVQPPIATNDHMVACALAVGHAADEVRDVLRAVFDESEIDLLTVPEGRPAGYGSPPALPEAL
jgi:biotin carboxylase